MAWVPSGNKLLSESVLAKFHDKSLCFLGVSELNHSDIDINNTLTGLSTFLLSRETRVDL